MKKQNGVIPLPEIRKEHLDFRHFPTRMQALIFRNWDIVPEGKIADCLKCSVADVRKQAYKMGLSPQRNVSLWAERGYISIIKVNWQIVPYKQLLILLGWDEERLALVLKEEDFLGEKMGSFKDNCEEILYRELSDEEEKQTEFIKEVITTDFFETEEDKEPFDFCFADSSVEAQATFDYINKIIVDDTWYIRDTTEDKYVQQMAERFKKNVHKAWNINLCGNDKVIELKFFPEKRSEEYHEIEICEDKITITAADSAGILRALTYLEDLANNASRMCFEKTIYKRTAAFKTRYIYSFCGLYNDAFDVDSEIYCPDSLLESYARTGVNGIWLQAILYRLSEFPFEPSLSKGYEKRISNLQSFIERAKAYGIKVYLYINEPRAMPLSFFEKRPELLGSYDELRGCLCTSNPQVQEYLFKAIEFICTKTPDIGGFFTITLSENTTNCYSRVAEMTKLCPICSKRKMSEIVAEVNAIVARAAHKVNPEIKIFAWDWAWRREAYMYSGEIKECIESLPEDVILMSSRERGISTNIGGVKGEVSDYSMSVCGISPYALEEWHLAKETNHETAAKVQVNNTWECSTIPYLPVFSLLRENVEELKKVGVEHLMLSWTLGGYPSPNIKMVSELFFDTEGGTSENNIFKMLYADDAEVVKKATDFMSEAFKEFPFNILSVYLGPSNGGASNLLFSEPTGFRATMTGFTYDDIEAWRSIYPEEVFENQFKKLCEKWKIGLDLVQNIKNQELKCMAEGAYIQFKASYNQIKFVRARNCGDTNTMINIAKDEYDLAVRLHRIMQLYPQVGFEAANHYYYTQGMLKEKAINCKYIINKLRESIN